MNSELYCEIFGDKFSNIISLITAGIGTIVSQMWGGWTSEMSVLAWFMCIDYVMGVLCGNKKQQLSSEMAGKGIYKKIAILLLVAMAHKIDTITNGDGIVRSLVIFFYVGQEGISILENSAVLGLPIPDVLKDNLVQLQKGNKKEIEPVHPENTQEDE